MTRRSNRSRRRWTRRLLAGAVGMIASVALVAVPGPVTATGDTSDGGHGRGDEHVSPQTIATGLNAAWGIDAGPWLGSVLVAESGSGDVLKLWNGGRHVVASPGAGVVNVATDGWGASYLIGQAEEGPSNRRRCPPN